MPLASTALPARSQAGNMQGQQTAFITQTLTGCSKASLILQCLSRNASNQWSLHYPWQHPWIRINTFIWQGRINYITAGPSDIELHCRTARNTSCQYCARSKKSTWQQARPTNSFHNSNFDWLQQGPCIIPVSIHKRVKSMVSALPLARPLDSNSYLYLAGAN